MAREGRVNLKDAYGIVKSRRGMVVTATSALIHTATTQITSRSASEKLL